MFQNYYVCSSGRQKINGQWFTYTPYDFEQCQNISGTDKPGSVLRTMSCKTGVYAMEEYSIKRSSDGMLIMQYVDRYCDYSILGK